MRKMMPVTPKRIQRRAPIPSLRVSRITPAVIAAFAFLKWRYGCCVITGIPMKSTEARSSTSHAISPESSMIVTSRTTPIALLLE